MKKSMVALGVICAVVGLVLGVVLCQPEISRQREELSSARTQIEDLQSQVDQRDDALDTASQTISTLQSDLSSANDELEDVRDELEFLQNAVEYLGAYVEKDVAFLSLLSERLEAYPFTNATLLAELRDAGYDVDPAIASKIDEIISCIDMLTDWSARMPPETAPCEERYTWLMEGYPILGQYLIDYREFVQAFLEPIETLLTAVEGLSQEP
jgi:ABC-type transporter Mla subunit MlaD